MVRRILLLLVGFVFVPSFALAGSQTYSTPGTHTFTVPASYGSLSVKVWGGGGGGGGDNAPSPRNAADWDGGQSSFNGSIVASGGKGGSDADDAGAVGTGGVGGTGGTASGGDVNTPGEDGGDGARESGGNGGSSPNGGAGGAGVLDSPGLPGASPGGGGGGHSGAFGGGGGGGGGYASKSYAAGALSGTITVVIGSGGEPVGPDPRHDGGIGSAGRVEIAWVDVPPSAPPAASCSVSFDENPVESGDGTTIHWTSTGGEWMYINAIGYVQGSGSAWVQPSETTNYDGSVGHAASGGEVVDARCTATLTVSGPQCPAGQTWDGSECVNSCPAGFSGTPPACIFVGCPQGYELHGEQCVPIQGPQCAAYYCVGNDLYRNNAQCVGSLYQACAYGCSGGACALPDPTGNITATPSLVRSGQTTRVAWTTTYTEHGSCSVAEDNPAINDSGAGENGSFTSSVLHERTTYTLSCTGVSGRPFTDSAVVNIIPVFQEQ